MAQAFGLPLTEIRGELSRLIPSKFPVIGIYDSVSSPDELDALMEIEARTNARVAYERQVLLTLPREQWVTGPGATPLMAALCNPNPDGSRFADHRYGVYYAGLSLQTAQMESVFHTERFARASTAVDPGIFVKRLYTCRLAQPLPTLDAAGNSQLLNPLIDSYPQSQAFAHRLRCAGAVGLHYPSVRDVGGYCAAVFDPRAVRLPVVAAAHFQFHWDGARVTHITEVGDTKVVVS